METLSMLLTLCAGNSPVIGEFSSQRSVTRSFDVFFDLRPNKRLSEQSVDCWFETSSRSLWRQCNGIARPSQIRFNRQKLVPQYIHSNTVRYKKLKGFFHCDSNYMRLEFDKIEFSKDFGWIVHIVMGCWFAYCSMWMSPTLGPTIF